MTLRPDSRGLPAQRCRPMRHNPRLLSTARTHDGLMSAAQRRSRHQLALRLLALTLLLFAAGVVRAQSPRRAGHDVDKPMLLPASRLKQCAHNLVCLRLLAEYGAVFSADTGQVTLPSSYVFRGEVEVKSSRSVRGARPKWSAASASSYSRTL